MRAPRFLGCLDNHPLGKVRLRRCGDKTVDVFLADCPFRGEELALDGGESAVMPRCHQVDPGVRSVVPLLGRPLSPSLDSFESKRLHRICYQPGLGQLLKGSAFVPFRDGSCPVGLQQPFNRRHLTFSI